MYKKLLSIFFVLLGVAMMAPTAHSAEWRWNGYFGANYEDSTQQGSSGSFDSFILSLISNIKINDELRVVAQVDWEHGPFIDIEKEGDTTEFDQRSSGEISLSNVYGEYAFAGYLKIRAGKFFAPIGIYNQIFYAVPSYPTLKIPQESVNKRRGNIAQDAVFFQRFAQGLWLGGDYPAMSGSLYYDIYLTNGRVFEQHVDENSSKSVGARVKFALPVREITITPLVSYYRDKFNGNTAGPLMPIWQKQSSIIPGIEFTAGDLVIRGEYAISSIKNVDGSGKTDLSAYYAEGYYTFLERFTPFVRYEFFEPNKDVADNQETETTVGISYHIVPWTAQVKLQARFHDFETETATNQSYNVYGIGLALGF